MIRFARSVTNSVKSHTLQLNALHSKSTPWQLSVSGIRSVMRNCCLGYLFTIFAVLVKVVFTRHCDLIGINVLLAGVFRIKFRVKIEVSILADGGMRNREAIKSVSPQTVKASRAKRNFHRCQQWALFNYFGLHALFVTIIPCDECNFCVPLFADANNPHFLPKLIKDSFIKEATDVCDVHFTP